MPGQIEPGRIIYLPLFRESHGFGGISGRSALPVFHLREDEVGPFLTDNIYFPCPGAEVSFYYCKTVILQVGAGQIFFGSAECPLVFRHILYSGILLAARPLLLSACNLCHACRAAKFFLDLVHAVDEDEDLGHDLV